LAKDKLHEIVKRALIKDGWTITHDPFFLNVKPKKQEIDLGAEKIIAAERGADKIAVEVKSFLNKSHLYDFYEALGQYISYRIGLRLQESERFLYLAIPDKVFESLGNYTTVPLTIEEERLKIVIFDPITEEIIKWL